MLADCRRRQFEDELFILPEVSNLATMAATYLALATDSGSLRRKFHTRISTG